MCGITSRNCWKIRKDKFYFSQKMKNGQDGHTSNASFKECIRMRSRSLLSSRRRFRSRALMHVFLRRVADPPPDEPPPLLALPPCFRRLRLVASSLLDSDMSPSCFISISSTSTSSSSSSSSRHDVISRDRIIERASWPETEAVCYSVTNVTQYSY